MQAHPHRDTGECVGSAFAPLRNLAAGSGPVPDRRGAIDSVEASLFRLCREIAGALLRGVQEGRDPAAWRSAVQTALQERTGFPDAQAWSLVELALELIRLQREGRYRRDELGLDRLVTGALGGAPGEGWN